MTRPQVSVILRGGFGNQLFQYAAALHAARRRGGAGPLVLSYGNEWGDEHPTLGSVLPVPVRYPDRRLRSTIPGIAVRESWKDAVSGALARITGRVSRTTVWKQSDPFSPDQPPPRRPVVLDGWFQHPAWWAETWRAVAGELATAAPMGRADLAGRGLAAVHVRRGDYLASGWELDPDTYRQAFHALGWRDRQVLVVAGDEEARAFIVAILREFGCDALAPAPMTGNPNIDDFWNLSSAEELVIANSSYSWWAAATGRAAGTTRRVAFPGPWLPNCWGEGDLPSMGPSDDDWIPIPSYF